MKKIIYIVAGLFLALVSVTYAQNISFPVADLGNCADKESCKAYCDTAGHEESCLNFAKKQGLMSSSEVEQAKKFVGQTGPGGCKGNECKTYCDSGDHADVCIDFAVKKGFMSKDEAERAKKFQKATEQGGPGGCTKEGCRQYCESKDHQEECFKFAEKNGLVPKEEVVRHEQGQKILEKIKESGGPGSCKSEGECRNYCSNSGHVEECIGFASAVGGLTPEEARSKLKEFSKEADSRNFSQQNNQDFRGQGPNGIDMPNNTNMMEMPNEAQRLERFKQFEEQYKRGQDSYQVQNGTDERGVKNVQQGDNKDRGAMMPRPDMKMPVEVKMTPEMQKQYQNQYRDQYKDMPQDIRQSQQTPVEVKMTPEIQNMQKNYQTMPTTQTTIQAIPSGQTPMQTGQMPYGQMPTQTGQMPTGMTSEQMKSMQNSYQNSGTMPMQGSMPTGGMMPSSGGSMPSGGSYTMPSGGSMPSGGGMPSGGSMPSGGGGMMMSAPHSMNTSTRFNASVFDSAGYIQSVIERRNK